MNERIAARAVWFISAVVVLIAGSALRAEVIICSKADNDLFRQIPGAKRVDTPAQAIESAAEKSAVLILSDGYPQTPVAVSNELYTVAAKKHLRLYVEYPDHIPGVETGETKTITWERGVVASDFFGPDLSRLRIVAPHDCHYITVKTPQHSHLAIARVAGYDTAVYGIPKDAAPLLFSTHEEQWLFATTKLSGFVTGRFAPTADWKIVWRAILNQLDPANDPPPLDAPPTVYPALSADAPKPATLEADTLKRGAEWYLRSKLVLTPQRRTQIQPLLAAGTEITDPPADDSNGDGTLGMLEGYASQVRFDGSQPQRTPIRADCNAEAAMVLSLAGGDRGKQVASNLLDYVFGPEMQSRGRSDPKHPSFGLVAWGAVSPAWEIANYGDDNARVILATIFSSAALKADRWDEPVLRALLANLRTTGKKGFRGDRIDIGQLEQLGWKHFETADSVNLAPHFEGFLWTCYLWAYARTGEKEFLDKSLIAIRMTMDGYPKKQWRWMDNMERAHMLWCLAWLVRVEDTPEHRTWLMAVANDLLNAQQPSGAIQERLGGTGGGHYQIPQSNEAYGTAETPLIQKVGDPATDQLYATGFSLIALHEAAAATGDAKLMAAEDKLAEYLCRIQVRSEKIPYLDGAWFRAFDYKRWDYWASNADMGWGVWSVEAGWGQSWIAATLALRENRTTLWEMTKESQIKKQLDKVRADMAQNAGGPLIKKK